MKLKPKAFYVGLNLLAPGFGQFALKWYFRGLLELLGSIFGFFWAAWEIFMPMVRFITGDITRDNLPVFNWAALGSAIALVILIWLWSIVEILLFCPKNKPDSAVEDKNETQI
jgi:hypothetical protein